MKNGFTFCTCSVNQYYCNHTHAQYRLETPAEFKRYLPVAMASFATGNNIWGENSRADGGGTSTAFMKRATEAYGLYFTLTKDRDAALSALEDGAMVVASTGGASSPFTGGGHYLTLASVYEGKVYILDPYLKTDYSKTDKRHLLTQIEPGLLEPTLRISTSCCCIRFISSIRRSIKRPEAACTSDRVIPNSNFLHEAGEKKKQRFPHAICRNTLLFFEKMDRKCFFTCIAQRYAKWEIQEPQVPEGVWGRTPTPFFLTRREGAEAPPRPR